MLRSARGSHYQRGWLGWLRGSVCACASRGTRLAYAGGKIIVSGIFVPCWQMLHLRMKPVATYLKSTCVGLAFVLLALAACGSETTTSVSDPPGALVRLQRNDAATTLPGDFTVFSSGGLQLYLGDRGALRKTLVPADLAGLQAVLNDSALDTLADSYPATLPANAGDTLTIYGTQRRTIRYDPSSPDLPPVLQRLISEVMGLRGRF
jgi:hypothetical protein